MMSFSVKIRARVLDLWLESVLGLSDPKQVFRPQIPRYFLRFENFIGFNL